MQNMIPALYKESCYCQIGKQPKETNFYNEGDIT